jgi:hypothetical protein
VDEKGGTCSMHTSRFLQFETILISKLISVFSGALEKTRAAIAQSV